MICRASSRSSASAQRLGKSTLILPRGDLVLELGGAPAGAPVELQPFLDAEGLGLRVVREDAGVGDRIARADEAVIGVLASRVDLLAADHGGGRGRIALGLSGDLAHVAVLAGDARFACRAVAILIPHDLELDAQVDGNLMAADAELRLGELGVRHHAVVDVRAPPVFAGFDGVGFLVGEDVFDDALFAAAVDRLEDLARLDPALAVDLAVLLLDPVAGDAGHALARDLAARPKRRFAVLAELGADLLVAAHAEGADRTLGQFLKLLLERVEHRRDRRIGVLRGRPFLVDLLSGIGHIAQRWDRGRGSPRRRREWELPCPSRLLPLLRARTSARGRPLLRPQTASARRPPNRLSWPLPYSGRVSSPSGLVRLST